MLTSFVIMLREGMEAALIIGIILAYLTQINKKEYNRHVYLGIGAAAVASIVTALLFYVLAGGFEGKSEEIFEGIAMLTAVVVLTYMIFWMKNQAKNIKGELHQKVITEVREKHAFGLAFLAFISVYREGVESVLFLGAATMQANDILLGALLGSATAVVIAYLSFTTTRKMNISNFFNLTSVVLIIFAAGLFANGMHELQEAGAVPVIAEHVWDTNHILNEKGTLGAVLKSLVGYYGNPSLLEVVSYLGYWLVVGTMVHTGFGHKPVVAREGDLKILKHE